MVRLFSSLRLQLILMFVIVFGLIQAGLTGIGLLVTQNRLGDYFDQELLRRVDGMADELVRSRKRFFPEPLPRVIDQQTSTIFFRDFYVQLRDGDGKLIERSANLDQFQLPFSNEKPARPQILQTVGGPEVENLVGAGQRLRMVTRRIDEPGMTTLFLQMAASLQPLEASIRLLHTLFFLGLPIGLLTAGGVAWWVIGRALRQIHLVSDFARRVTPDQLDHQLPVPAGHDEISQMVAHVNQMLQRLHQGFRAQEHFLHDVSHELKTPLSSLLSEAQWLRQREVSPREYQQFVCSVEQETRHLGRMVQSLLLLGRPDSHEAVRQRELASLNDVVEFAAQECRYVADAGGVRLTVQLAMPDDDGEPMCRGDRELLGVMVSNLIRNAVQFSPAEHDVEIEVIRRDAWADIVVRDHGPGVPPEAMEKIFDRFAQGVAGPRRGTGLGLAIARMVAQLHGGSLTVANRSGGGCAFTAVIPVFTAASTPPESAPRAD